MRGVCLSIAGFLASSLLTPMSVRGVRLSIAGLLASSLFSPLSAEGQANIRLGAGPGMPVGALADGSKVVGPSFLAGVAIPVDHGYYLLIEGHHGRFGSDRETRTDTNAGAEPRSGARLTGGNAGLLIEGIADPVGFYGHGGVGWVGGTGNGDPSIGGEDASVGTADHSFMFVLGIGVNIMISDRLGLTLNARYNHALDAFAERVQWIPVTASVVLQL